MAFFLFYQDKNNKRNQTSLSLIVPPQLDIMFYQCGPIIVFLPIYAWQSGGHFELSNMATGDQILNVGRWIMNVEGLIYTW